MVENTYRDRARYQSFVPTSLDATFPRYETFKYQGVLETLVEEDGDEESILDQTMVIGSGAFASKILVTGAAEFDTREALDAANFWSDNFYGLLPDGGHDFVKEPGRLPESFDSTLLLLPNLYDRESGELLGQYIHSLPGRPCEYLQQVYSLAQCSIDFTGKTISLKSGVQDLFRIGESGEGVHSGLRENPGGYWGDSNEYQKIFNDQGLVFECTTGGLWVDRDDMETKPDYYFVSGLWLLGQNTEMVLDEVQSSIVNDIVDEAIVRNSVFSYLKLEQAYG